MLFLLALAGTGYWIVRHRGLNGSRTTPAWLRPAATPSAPVTLGRTSLSPQASVHVIEWHGEELLIGCTAQSVTMLARRPKAATAKDAM